MARCNKSLYAILGFISKRPMSGYDIKQILERTSKTFWAESNAQIYPCLKRLEEKGCVTSYIDESSGARKRRIYEITAQGVEKLREWLLEPTEYPTFRDELLLKVCLGKNIENTQLLSQLEDFLDYLHQQIKDIEKMRKYKESLYKDKPDMPYAMLTYDFSLEMCNCKLKWCQRAIKQIKQWDKD